jgi:hypothetical protein
MWKRSAIAISLAFAALALADDDGWQRVEQQDGIVVSTREQPGKQMPSFRGQAELKGPVLQVLAVVLDDQRSGEWAKDADEAELLRSIDDKTQIVYTRSHQRWPIRDRDLVLRRTIEVVSRGREYRVRLRCIGGEKPELAGVIRVKDCETSFLLRRVDPDTTYVDYQVRADPGGANPAWAVKWASKNIPFETLSALRRQLQKTREDYLDDMQRLARY